MVLERKVMTKVGFCFLFRGIAIVIVGADFGFSGQDLCGIGWR